MYSKKLNSFSFVCNMFYFTIFCSHVVTHFASSWLKKSEAPFNAMHDLLIRSSLIKETIENKFAN